MRRIKSQPKKLVQILAIKHDRDYVGDDFWQPSTEKPHYHIIVRYVGQDKRMRVQQILRQMGVKYREEDKNLWACHGVETVGDFAGYAMYLTHETPDAERDGKTLYRIEEIVSNLTLDEIKEIRNGYVRVGTGKISKGDMSMRDNEAYQLGLELGNFKKWFGSLDFKTRDHTSMKTVKASYYRGVEDRVEQDNAVNRLCIFIGGGTDKGKTYAAEEALKGIPFVEISGQGSGRYDDLKPHHDALVINDDKGTNLLNMCDNYMCKVYRRNSDNPYWCGSWYIVTSNETFEQWILDSGVTNDEHVKAIKSRFYICHVETDASGKDRLVCTSVSRRGTDEMQEDKIKRFLDFREKFEKSMAEYKVIQQAAQNVDYSAVLGVPTPPAPTTPTEWDDDDPPFT